MENGQLLERFRLLSRDIQNGIQNAQKQLDAIKKTNQSFELSKLSTTLSQIDECWQDFAGWVLVSTLDDLEEARQNCAPGRLDIQSKVTRAKIKRQADIGRKGITLDISGTKSTVIETYIQYFEQLIDLIIGNAIKYCPKAGVIEISCERTKSGGASIFFKSLGPIVQKNEVDKLGTRGFRSQAAQGMPVTGQGYGLSNAKMLADLLCGDIKFSPEQRQIFELGGIPFAYFSVSIILPDSPIS